ncbi:MAG: flagellar basal body-associated FliL family protein [Lachnospiraceae bacterium]|nr:flagellar basal body-associated FliL family protein [Lachnospiraceae bacterium]MDD7669261.1 flagellar basal body-associated FliL family protein [Lachnospiraceae bacterium]MDY2620872.1 flagellar basal body-associated FliL family protein [Agathobacter sp.]
MKKNLISVLILALVFANFVLTAILMFTVLPETQKANTLIEKVCSAIDLDLNSGGTNETSNIPIDQQDTYKVNEGEKITTNLAKGNDGKSHYAIVKVSLVLNKKSDNYATYNQEFLANQDETIKNDVIQVIGQYTLDEFETNKEQVKSEILSDMQKLFGADLVIGVNFSESTSE